MTESTYLLAWLIYLLASACLSFAVWQLLKAYLSVPASVVLLPLAALLITPYFSDPEQSRLAPAILTTLFEGIFGNGKIALKALIPLAATFGSSLLYLILRNTQKKPVK